MELANITYILQLQTWIQLGTWGPFDTEIQLIFFMRYIWVLLRMYVQASASERRHLAIKMLNSFSYEGLF